MTEKLYYQTDYIRDFEAEVLECCPGKIGGFEVILDRSAFYPKGGGQPHDTGWLDDIQVLEVHEKDGMILHLTELPIEPGKRVHGVLNWERRYRHMQLHSGEHLLSGLIHKQYGYDNIGFHMGKEEVTIDFKGILSSGQLWALEIEANHMIYVNIEIKASYPDKAALSELDYRSKKELTGDVRIVDIPGGDRCACCGTHVKYTGEIGMIKATGMIHYKGGVRISMQCGLTALEDYEHRLQQTAGISRLLSAKQTELVGAVEKMKLDSEKKDETIGGLYQQLIELKVSGYPDSTEPLLIFGTELPAFYLRQLCTILYEGGKGTIVMVCTGSGENYNYVAGSSIQDMRMFSRALNQGLDGRGGGSALMAQGTFHASQEAINKAFYDLVNSTKN